ncbi:MAG: ElyC/SanA/YdcF family protein [Candidatus Pacebacteria bacterium]|nr:ElyC/SanA/YdcF family protein [Candidatus Paceibacterota bacterium]
MKLKRFSIKRLVLVMAAIAVCSVVAVLAINFMVQKTSEGFIYDADDVPQKEVALVLGAKVHENGRLSDMFRDRVDKAIGLYEAGKVDKILVSGDHGTEEYDEVNAAKDYLLQSGVSGADIFLDHAGFDTYDSVYRARDIFQAESMIIVTQRYHLPRALYIADKLGVDAVGVSADLHTYGGEDYRNFREEFAIVKAWLDVALKSKPKFLGEPIPISGEGFASWD